MESKKRERETIKGLSPEQVQVYDAIESGKCVFFTGAGGTGKSYLLNMIRTHLATDRFYFTAMTGLAAVAIGGCTLHSFAGIGLGDANDLYEVASKWPKVVKRWKTVQTLLIDEISMLDAELFDKIEALARQFRNPYLFFGGIQVIFVGDFFQLPPMLFHSQVWQNSDVLKFELKHNFRQRNVVMLDALGDLRRGIVSQRLQDFIQSVKRPLVFSDGIEPTKLFARNLNVDQENAARLQQLTEPTFEFKAQSTGEQIHQQDLSRNCMASDVIVLKVGAQVMYLVNNPIEGVMNGSRGVVVDFDKSKNNSPIVQFTHCKLTVSQFRWEKRVGRELLATRLQIPLKLAWALSIHKSQGMSLDRVTLALADCFERGQAYVALSRATCAEGLEITTFDPTSIIVDSDVIAYHTKTFVEKN